MGAFDQFKDRSDQSADEAKEALGNKRRKGMEAEDPERMDPERMQQDQRRGSDSEDRARRRMDGTESGMDDSDWT